MFQHEHPAINAFYRFLQKGSLDSVNASLLRLAQQSVQMLMELDVEYQIGAGHYQRSDARRTYRNGYRRSNWYSNLGKLELQIPKLRSGSYYPAFLGDSTFDICLVDFVKAAFAYGIDEFAVTSLIDSILPKHLISDSDRSTFLTVLSDALYLNQNKFFSVHFTTLFVDAIYLNSEQSWLIILYTFDNLNLGEYVAHEFTTSLDFAFWSMLLRKIQSTSTDMLNRIVSDDLRDLRFTLDMVMPEVDWQHISILTRFANQPEELVDAVSDLSVETGSNTVSRAVDWQLDSTISPKSVLLNAA